MFKFPLLKKKNETHNIKIIHDKNISSDLVQNLYLSVGWQYRNIQDIKKSFENSILITSAWDDDRLIAIGRATGDGIFNATIWDVAVRPAYQKHGIGSLIINSMLTKLDGCGIPLITLYAETSKKDFYSKLGFEVNYNKVVGMYRYKNNRRNE